MKTIRLLSLALLMAAIPGCAGAQKVFLKAIDDFLGNGIVANHTTSHILNETSRPTGKTVSEYAEYNFSIPASLKDKLDNVAAAFRKDINSAYFATAKDAGTIGGTPVTVAYGKNLGRSVMFGYDRDNKTTYMVMLVEDRQDTLMRYAYGLKWHFEGNENSSINGSIYKIHSLDPQRDSNRNKSQNMGATRMGTILSGTDMIKNFSNLRSAYITAERQHADINLRTGIVNKIVELCSNSFIRPDKTEKEIMTNGLKELQQCSTDEYLTSLLGLAIQRVRK